jgi:hypothetical protein
MIPSRHLAPRPHQRRGWASGRYPARRLPAAGHRRDRLPPLRAPGRNLLFALIARRYEGGSIIVTSNRGIEARREILGDAMVAAALIARLVHHATMITLKRKSYRLHERAAATTTPRQRARPTQHSSTRGAGLAGYAGSHPLTAGPLLDS